MGCEKCILRWLPCTVGGGSSPSFFFFFFFLTIRGKKKAVYLVVNEDFREKFVLFITIEMQ